MAFLFLKVQCQFQLHWKMECNLWFHFKPHFHLSYFWFLSSAKNKKKRCEKLEVKTHTTISEKQKWVRIATKSGRNKSEWESRRAKKEELTLQEFRSMDDGSLPRAVADLRLPTVLQSLLTPYAVTFSLSQVTEGNAVGWNVKWLNSE